MLLEVSGWATAVAGLKGLVPFKSSCLKSCSRMGSIFLGIVTSLPTARACEYMSPSENPRYDPQVCKVKACVWVRVQCPCKFQECISRVLGSIDAFPELLVFKVLKGLLGGAHLPLHQHRSGICSRLSTPLLPQ